MTSTYLLWPPVYKAFVHDVTLNESTGIGKLPTPQLISPPICCSLDVQGHYNRQLIAALQAAAALHRSADGRSINVSIQHGIL